MRAAWYERIGPAQEVLTVGEMPTPEVHPGEVRVRIYSSGVNPSDTKRRGGRRGGGMEFARIIPHSDGAGVIEAVGEGVPPTRVGERVWLWNAQFGRPFGTAAQYVMLPSRQAICLPDDVSFAEGACLGIPAMTAHRCVFADGPVRGQDILVAGGAGAVGYYAIEWAKWGGARVLTTVSSPAKAELARAAGADYVVEYTSEDVVARIEEITGGRGVDRIIEVAFGRNLATDLRVLRSNGVIAAYGSDAVQEPVLPFYALLGASITLRFILVYLLPEAVREQAIADITTCLEAGALGHPPLHHFPLTQIAAAHEAVESGSVMGKVVLDID